MSEQKINVRQTAAEIELLLLTSISALLDIPEEQVDRTEAFASYGLQSKDIVVLVAKLESYVGRKLSIAAAFNHPTIEALALYLAQEMSADASGTSVANERAGAEFRPRSRRGADAEDPVVIVGIGCRYPGGIRDPEGFWKVLEQAQHTITEVPSERWDMDAIYDPDPDVRGKSMTRYGGFLHDIDKFDAEFFEIPDREASSIDPQHRLLLEVAWEALEHAGVVPTSLMDSDAGVFVGLIYHDYEVMRGVDLERLDGYVATGAAASVASGRLSYVLGARGPSVTVDTACSTSLVALELAVRSLQAGECSLALAGAATLILTPAVHVEFSRLRGLAEDGRVKSFDALADGTTWSEGCGVLVLKRMSDALANGDRILAVVRGSAMNQDGRSNGLIAPNPVAQEEVVTKALVNAGVERGAVDYVETHGTGTPVGDPIEVHALSRSLGLGRASDMPLLIGAVKSNLGHTQAAAGMAGVIKVVLALEAECIPRTLHFEVPNPRICWEGSGIKVVSETHAWPRDAQRPRIAGISSFGISGTNVHVILEEPPARVAANADAEAALEQSLPLLLSGQTEAALRDNATRWAAWLRAHPAQRWQDVVYTAALRRGHLEERAAIVARDVSDVVHGLDAVAEGRALPHVSRGRARRKGKAVFVFPGQGSQWRGMAEKLLLESEAFARAVDACDATLLPLIGWSVTALLRGAKDASIPPFDRVDVVQPALFTMGVALAETWRSLGVEPGAVVGHSQGEIVAAVVAGALSLADGAKVVARRSQALRSLTGRGTMLVIERPVEEVRRYIEPFGDALAVAVVNTASSTVVSGSTAAVDALVERLSGQDLFVRKVNVDYASHTAQMDALLPAIRAGLADIDPRPPRVPFYSTVLGGLLGEAQPLDADYWCRNLRQTVRLDLALAQIRADGLKAFVEVSSHPVLAMPLATACEEDGVVVDSLQREHGDLGKLYKSLGSLHAHGFEVDWKRALAGLNGRLLSLPSYAFQRQRYWQEPPKKQHDARSLGMSLVEHPLLAATAQLADSDGSLFTGRLSLKDSAWLRDHSVYGTTLFPGAGTVELALCAARALEARGVAEIALTQPLVLGDEPMQLQLSVSASDEQGARSFTLYSRPELEGNSWVENAAGVLTQDTSDASERSGFDDLQAWPVDAWQQVDLAGLYERLRSKGLEYGPEFQGLKQLWHSETATYARIVLPQSVKDADAYGIHPALLDAALHSMLASLTDELETAVLLPFSWSDVELFATGARELRVKVQVAFDKGAGHATASLWMADASGEPVLYVGGLQARHARPEQLRVTDDRATRDLLKVEFQPVLVGPGTGQADDAATAVIWDSGLLRGSLAADGYPDLKELLTDMDANGGTPSRIIVDATRLEHGERDTAAQALQKVLRALAVLQGWLDEPRFSSTALIWITRGAISTSASDALTDLVHAPVWGLVRAARAEQPDRVLKLVDVGPGPLDRGSLVLALNERNEPELALRRDQLLAPRLARAGACEASSSPTLTIDPLRSVLVTGGTGELGRAVCEHLVRAHGVRHLTLTSRRGLDAPGAQELVERLQAAGAESVQVLACDVGVLAEAEQAVSCASAVRPLKAVFHLAGVLDDGIVSAQTPERVQRVMAPKVDGALHLQALTQAMSLTAFVIFSSAAGTLGSPGQSSYAAANTFLDALSVHRRQRGLPTLSLAWGLWQQSGVGMTAHLSEADLARMARQGMQAMSVHDGLKLMDAALLRPEAYLAPIRLDVARMQRQMAGAEPPALMRLLVRPNLRRAAVSRREASELRSRLAALPASERPAFLTRLVRTEVATVLGLGDPMAIDPQRELRKLGLDSLMAVQLRNRLSALVGHPLPSTIAFDHPTPAAIADFVAEKLEVKPLDDEQTVPTDPAKALKWALERVSPRQLQQSGLLASLLQLARPNGHSKAEDEGGLRVRPEHMTLDAIRSELTGILGG